jgi:hypothetical protein
MAPCRFVREKQTAFVRFMVTNLAHIRERNSLRFYGKHCNRQIDRIWECNRFMFRENNTIPVSNRFFQEFGHCFWRRRFKVIRQLVIRYRVIGKTHRTGKFIEPPPRPLPCQPTLPAVREISFSIQNRNKQEARSTSVIEPISRRFVCENHFVKKHGVFSHTF